MGIEQTMPTNFPQFYYTLVIIFGTILFFLLTWLLKNLYTTVGKHGDRLAKLETAHRIHHPGELNGKDN
jgi:hypothetical protein